ncbi:hypothetical protein L1887_23299 [Cichorium endivia]|nr:hypothetical protein L1887_23299 [Cichorium endivia]
MDGEPQEAQRPFLPPYNLFFPLNRNISFIRFTTFPGSLSPVFLLLPFCSSRNPLIPLSIMANAASGMAVNDECKLKFLELKAKRTFRYITYKIIDQQVMIDKIGSSEESYEDFTNSLPADECRYAVYDFDFTTDENCQKSKIFFIAWSPDTSKVRMKMVYASSKDRFKRELDGIQVELQATDPSEMSMDVIKTRAL